jgi:hypothetical protein
MTGQGAPDRRAGQDSTLYLDQAAQPWQLSINASAFHPDLSPWHTR